MPILIICAIIAIIIQTPIGTWMKGKINSLYQKL